jgi:hypothetical protein
MHYIVQVRLPDSLADIEYKCPEYEMAWRKAHAAMHTYTRERCIIDIWRVCGTRSKLVCHIDSEED